MSCKRESSPQATKYGIASTAWSGVCFAREMGYRLRLPSRLFLLLGIWGYLSPTSAWLVFSPVLAILRQHASMNRACVFWLMHDKRFRCTGVISMTAPVKATVVCQCPKSLFLPQTVSDEDHGPAGPITALA